MVDVLIAVVSNYKFLEVRHSLDLNAEGGDLAAVAAVAVAALGALAFYVSHADAKHFQPMNISFGLLQSPEIQAIKDKRRKKELLAENALEAIRNSPDHDARCARTR